MEEPHEMLPAERMRWERGEERYIYYIIYIYMHSVINKQVSEERENTLLIIAAATLLACLSLTVDNVEEPHEMVEAE